MRNSVQSIVLLSLISSSLTAMDNHATPVYEQSLLEYSHKKKFALGQQWFALVDDNLKIRDLNSRMGGSANFSAEHLFKVLQKEIKRAIEELHNSSLENCSRTQRFHANGKFDADSFYGHAVLAEHDFFSALNMVRAAYDKRFYELAWLIASLAEQVFADLAKDKEITDEVIKAGRAIAQSYVGLMYTKGLGVAANQDEALKFLTAGAKTFAGFKGEKPVSPVAPNKLIALLLPICAQAAHAIR